jgi:hypothetical protein
MSDAMMGQDAHTRMHVANRKIIAKRSHIRALGCVEEHVQTHQRLHEQAQLTCANIEF